MHDRIYSNVVFFLVLGLAILAQGSCGAYSALYIPHNDVHPFTVVDAVTKEKRLLQYDDLDADLEIVRLEDNRYHAVGYSSADKDGQNASGKIKKPEVHTYHFMARPELFYVAADSGLCYDTRLPGAKRIVVFSVHGTWTTARSMGLHETKITTRRLHEFVKFLSDAYGVAVELVVCEWSGVLRHAARRTAGHEIAELFKNVVDSFGYDAIESTWSICHSHGCNVVHHAVKELERQEYPYTIHTALHLASPALDPDAQPDDDKPYNYHRLYHCYSSMDFSQLVGSVLQYCWPRRTIPHGRTKEGYVYNIRVRNDGEFLDHISIKAPTLFNLAGLIHALDTHYVNHYDLEANFLIDEHNEQRRLYPLVTLSTSHFKDLEVHDVHQAVLAISDYNANHFKTLYGKEIGSWPSWWDLLCMYSREQQSRAGLRGSLSFPTRSGIHREPGTGEPRAGTF